MLCGLIGNGRVAADDSTWKLNEIPPSDSVAIDGENEYTHPAVEEYGSIKLPMEYLKPMELPPSDGLVLPDGVYPSEKNQNQSVNWFGSPLLILAGMLVVGGILVLLRNKIEPCKKLGIRDNEEANERNIF